MKNVIQRICKKFGFEIHRVDGRGSLIGALRNLKSQGLLPDLIIDGGAAHGSWTIEVQKVFPTSQYIAIEPLAEHYPALEALPHTRVVKGALAHTHGEVTLHVHNEYNSSITSENLSAEQRTVPAFTIDEILGNATNVLLKLDVEGAELDVLRDTPLKGVVALILECSFFSNFKNHILFPEVCAFMKAKGFVPHDLFTMAYDSATHTFMQADVLFLPETSSLRATTK